MSTSSYSEHQLKPFKIVFLGDNYVGKTSLITKFMYDTFDIECKATIGVDFVTKTMYLDPKDRTRSVRLQIWDTAGQERYREFSLSLVRNSTVAVVIVYDITNDHSFREASKWIDDVKTEFGSSMIIMLVGGKTDRSDKRQVSTEEGEQKAKEQNAMFIETSAKEGYNVNELFHRLTAALPGINSSDTKVISTEDSMQEVILNDAPSASESKAEIRCACTML